MRPFRKHNKRPYIVSETALKDKFETGKIYMAEVMDTRNITRSGEIKIWVLGSDIPKDDSTRWLIAKYASPFYGTTPYDPNSVVDYEDDAPTSFGAWFPMPFVGNYVFIFFPYIVGSNINPYWFSCPMNPNMNSMLPGIPSQYFNETREPMTEGNDKFSESGKSDLLYATLSKRESKRGSYTPLKKALEEQGLETDNIRGYSTAGSKREAPSMCYGFLTPMGNSFTMDDGWSDKDNKDNWQMNPYPTKREAELRNDAGYLPTHDMNVKRNNAGFRLRTRNGSQLWIGDDGDIYAINSKGNAWLELSQDGKIHGYSANSIDLATDGDFNVHSNQKIRMEAKEGIVMKTSKDISIQSAGNTNISAPHIHAEAEMTVPTFYADTSTINSLTSSDAALNGMFSGTLDGTAFYATYAGNVPYAQVTPVTEVYNIPAPEIEMATSVSTTVGQSVDTICSEVPAHEPYSGHTNRGEQYVAPVLDTNSQPSTVSSFVTSGGVITNQIGSVLPVAPDYTSDATIPNVQLSEHFTLAMLCYSDTAKKRGLSNVPTDAEIAKLKALAVNILEPVWSHYNQRVIVNSGYRGPALNRAVGGVTTSQHCRGEAADIEIAGISNYELACFIRDNLTFDQVILENANNVSIDPNAGWVHVSYNTGHNRRDVLTINRYGTTRGLNV